MSVVSEQANRQASGPVLTSLLLFVPDHSATARTIEEFLARVLAEKYDRLLSRNQGKRRDRVGVTWMVGGWDGRKVYRCKGWGLRTFFPRNEGNGGRVCVEHHMWIEV